jgi:hypothetical protein
MTTIRTIATLLLAAAATVAAPAQAQTKAALVQDAQRPTAQSIVSAHCAVAGLTCAVYTVPSGKILHVTQLGYLIANNNGSFIQWAFSGFTSLLYPATSGYTMGTDHVDLWMPAGSTITVNSHGGSNPTPSLDLSLFGTLTDQ